MTRANNRPLAPVVTAAATIVFGGISGVAFGVEPSPVEVGSWNLVPTLRTSLAHTDNLLYQPEDEISSEYFLVRPKLRGSLRNNADAYNLEAEVMNGEYSATKADDYTDWRVKADGHVELNSSNIVELNAEYYDAHEFRGTNFSQGQTIPDEPDRYEQTTAEGSYQFGSRETLGRVVLSSRYFDKHYTNNRMSTYYRDRQEVGWGTAFYLNLSPRTDVLLEYRVRDANYINDPAPNVLGRGTLDNENNYVYVGLEWQATAKTSGTAKLGYVQKEFEDPEREDADAPSWDISVEYRPLSYSVFSFTANRDYSEPNGIGNTIDRIRYTLDWEHEWSSQIKTTANLDVGTDSYEGFQREDNLNKFSVGVTYAFARWMDTMFTVSHDSLESDYITDRFDYTENRVTIGFEASL